MILVHLVSMSGAGCRVYIEGEVNVNVTNFLYLYNHFNINGNKEKHLFSPFSSVI